MKQIIGKKQPCRQCSHFPCMAISHMRLTHAAWSGVHMLKHFQLDTKDLAERQEQAIARWKEARKG